MEENKKSSITRVMRKFKYKSLFLSFEMVKEPKYTHNWDEKRHYKKKHYIGKRGKEVSRATHRRLKKQGWYLNAEGNKLIHDPNKEWKKVQGKNGKMVYESRLARKANKTYKLGDTDVDRKTYRMYKKRYRNKTRYYNQQLKRGATKGKNGRLYFDISVLKDATLAQDPTNWFDGDTNEKTQVFKWRIKSPGKGKNVSAEDRKAYEDWLEKWRKMRKTHNKMGKLKRKRKAKRVASPTLGGNPDFYAGKSVRQEEFDKPLSTKSLKSKIKPAVPENSKEMEDQLKKILFE